MSNQVRTDGSEKESDGLLARPRNQGFWTNRSPVSGDLFAFAEALRIAACSALSAPAHLDT